MKKTILITALGIVTMLVLFRLGAYSRFMKSMLYDWVLATIALIFLGIGWQLRKINLKEGELQKPKAIDHRKRKQLDISDREYQVLIEIANGLSNKEIGDKLFLSESTIKTHVSNLLCKLEVKRRTQAIQKAKALQILVS
ncbi:MAG: response regulator transcription factor [Bacteroidota bacterium]